MAGTSPGSGSNGIDIGTGVGTFQPTTDQPNPLQWTPVQRASYASEHPTWDLPSGSKSWQNQCLAFVRTMLDIPAKYGTASAAWAATPATDRNTDPSPPVGVPVFFSTSNPAGHVALSAGDGYVWSTDIGPQGNAPGQVRLVSIQTIESTWGAQYLGWADELNDRPIDASTGTPVSEQSSASSVTDKLGGAAGAVSGAVGSALSALNPATWVTGLVKDLETWLAGGLIRAAYFLGGAVLLIFFLWKAGGSS